MLAVVNLKNALEKVTDLNLNPLVTRVDQVAHQVDQEGASL